MNRGVLQQAPSRKERQAIFGSEFKIPKLFDSLCVLCGFARDSFSGLSGLRRKDE
jgi:hypothetical protein